jgi:hypothetical protein
MRSSSQAVSRDMLSDIPMTGSSPVGVKQNQGSERFKCSDPFTLSPARRRDAMFTWMMRSYILCGEIGIVAARVRVWGRAFASGDANYTGMRTTQT